MRRRLVSETSSTFSLGQDDAPSSPMTKSGRSVLSRLSRVLKLEKVMVPCLGLADRHVVETTLFRQDWGNDVSPKQTNVNKYALFPIKLQT